MKWEWSKLPLSDGRSRPEQIMANLDRMGEDRVREQLASGSFGNEAPIVQEWLRRRERTIELQVVSREDSLREEELRIARSASNAAWVASGAAIISVVVSLVALWFSLQR